MKERLQQFVELVRLRHWIKNGFVAVPAIFAGAITMENLAVLGQLFLIFCLLASVVYIFNDLMDAPRDRLHLHKHQRPIASGYYTPLQAIVVLTVLLALAACLLLTQTAALPYVTAYLLLNLGYTLFLKYVAIVDVSIIGLGFVLRILAGGAVIAVFVSQWLVTIVFLLTTALAFAKRRHDLSINAENEAYEPRISVYTLPFLDLAITIMLSITLLAYIIYSLSPQAMERLGTDQIYLTSFFVFLGILRYLLLVLNPDTSGSPVQLIWRDRVLQVTILAWCLSFYYLIYF
ncbi:MAG: UbiA prenyltransferase family protein [Bacteroidota bacterium]